MSQQKRQKESDKPFKLVTLDVETRGRFGEVFRIGIFDGESFFHSNDVNFILSHLQSMLQVYDLHIYTHFLDFDLSKILQHLLDIERIDFNRSLFINNRVVKFTTDNGMTFHDSYRMLLGSLEKLCDDFGLSLDDSKVDLESYMKQQGYKDKEDFFKNVPDDDPVLIHYLEMDCRSLYYILMEVIHLSGLPDKVFASCPTVASLANTFFKTFFKEEYKKAISTNYFGTEGEYLEQQIRSGYHGGRTEVYKPIAEDAFHYDVVSMYPAIMKEMEIPYGHYTIHRKTDKVKPKTVYMSHKLSGGKNGAGFALVKLFVPEDLNIPPLPYKFSRKLLFPTGYLWGVWSFEELKMAESFGVKIEDFQEVYFWSKKEKLFEGYIKFFEEMKQTSSGGKRAFAKLMQTSLYGRFAMRRIQTSYCNAEDEEKRQKEGSIYVKKQYTKFKGLEQEYIMYKSIAQSKTIQPHISAYITSYARVKLYNDMMEEMKNGAEIYYSDTDSLVTSKEMNPDKVGNEYGKWLPEGKISRGIYLQEKMYSELGVRWDELKQEFEEYEKTKAKGIIKDARMLDYKQFESFYMSLIDGEQKIKLYESYARRASLAYVLNGNKDVEEVVRESKHIALKRRKKRLIDYIRNVSIPHHFESYDAKTPRYWADEELENEMWKLAKIHDTPSGNYEGEES
ncbi:TPA: DNA polymerase [Bacillus cereus]